MISNMLITKLASNTSQLCDSSQIYKNSRTLVIKYFTNITTSFKTEFLSMWPSFYGGAD